MTQRPDCYYCSKHQTGEDPPAGGWLVADQDWLAGHGPAHTVREGQIDRCAAGRTSGRAWLPWLFFSPLIALYILWFAFVINEEFFTGLKVITMTNLFSD
jgi:hypothetical protein